MQHNRLLLVDASSYLYRAFHALPEFKSPGGEPTGAILGVINMLKKLKTDFPSDYSACVFDPKGRTFRDDIYPEYKATRTAIPEDLALQIAHLLVRGFDTAHRVRERISNVPRGPSHGVPVTTLRNLEAMLVREVLAVFSEHGSVLFVPHIADSLKE